MHVSVSARLHPGRGRDIEQFVDSLLAAAITRLDVARQDALRPLHGGEDLTLKLASSNSTRNAYSSHHSGEGKH